MVTNWDAVSAEEDEAYRRGRNDAIEECAKLAEAFDLPLCANGIKPRVAQVELTIAAAIRSLPRS